MTSTLRYFGLCLAGLAAACGEEGNDPAAPERITPQGTAAVETIITTPALGVSSHALYYCYHPGSTRNCVILKHQIQITSTGAPLRWTASTDKPWIVVSPASGTTPTTVTVSVALKAPQLSTIRGSVTIAAAGASNSPQHIRVEVNYTGRPPLLPALAFSDSAIGLCFYPTATRACVQTEEDVRFTSTGASLAWRAVSSVPWIVLHPTSGATPTTVRVAVDLTKVRVRIGTSVSGAITVSAAGARNSPQTIPVKLQFYNWPLPQ